MEGGHEAIATTIDERVVEMRFDNRQFEDGVQTSLSTLDKLKRSLNLEGAARGLEAVDEAARSCRMTPLSNAVDSVKLKFSALEVIAVTALANITNSVINTGKQMIKSLTIDPIKDGFEEYELKMNSVQTIMNSSGESLETVTGYLDELNTYADKTIYSFSDMTSNIGKFTNAGVSLDKSVKAIQGVSNVAALSGANTQQASHAMYNFAQALSSGAVKLIDWKSIETANMATVDFKNELIKTALALGTVKKKGEKYVTTTKDLRGKVSDAFDANSNFNESLSNQWLTSEVLIETLGRYSDETTEIGKKAFAAAQDVKTFSQLMDTLKEGVGSGWAQTWELIFGNFDEAKALWTEAYQFIGGFIDSMSNARNDILGDWNKLGGRAALLDSIRNTLKGIVSFIKPIKEGFKDIFPSITGKQLADFTEKIENLTSHFKIGDGTAEKIKNSFKGLFAVLDIGRQAVLSLTGLSPLVKILVGVLGKLGQGVLFVTNKMGLFATALDEFVKRHQIFNRAVDGIVSVIVALPDYLDALFQKLTGVSVGEAMRKIGEKFSEGATAFQEALSCFKKTDTDGFDVFFDKIRERLQPLSVLADGFKVFLNALLHLAQNLAPLVGGFVTVLGDAFRLLGEGIATFIAETDFDTLLDIINGGLMAGLGLSIRKFIDSLSSMTGNLSDISKNAGGIVGGIKEIFGGVTDCLSAMQENLKANVLSKIAAAIAVLTASLFVLSLIDSNKLTTAMTALVGNFVALFGSMTIFEHKMGTHGFDGLGKAARAMIQLSVAILILSFAMKNLASLDWDGVAKGLVSVSVLSGVLLLVAERLSENSGKMIRGATGLLIFALAVGLMAKAVKELGALKLEELAKGLGAVTVMIAQMIAFTRLIGNPGSMISTALGMVLIGSSMLLFARAVERMGALSVKEIAKGLFTMSAALAAVTIAVQFLPATTPIIALGLVLIGGALNLLALALAQMGKMSMAEVGKSLLLLAGSLTIIAVAVTLMVAALPGAAALVIISGAMVILAGALMILGKMSMAEVGKSLLALAGSLTIIAVAVTLMGAAIPGAAALLVVAGALAVLTPVLKVLGGMSVGSIVKALAALAGVFAVVGVGALLLAPAVPMILALAASLVVLGVGITAIGVGLTAIGAGITSIAVSMTASVASMIASLRLLIVGIISVIPDAIEAIVSIVPALTNALIIIIKSLCDVVIKCTPPLVKAIMVLVIEVLKALADHTPEIVEYLFTFLLGLIDGLTAYLPKLITSAVNLLSALFSGIIDALGGLSMDGLIKMVAGMGLVAAAMFLFSGIASIIPAAMAGVLGVGAVIAELGLVLAAIGLLRKIPGLSWAIDEGGKFLQQIGVAIGSFFGGILGGIAGGFSSQLPRIATDISLFMENLSPFITGAQSIDASAMNGVKALAEAILILTGANVINGLTNWITGGVSLKDFGEQISTFAPYLKTFSEAVKGIDGAAVESSANAAKALAEFARLVPNTGGLAAVFAGENTLSAFADELVAFAPKIKQYADSVVGLDPAVVEASANAARALAEMAVNLPNQGGVASWFAGENLLSTFGEELAKFAPGFKAYADAVVGISPETVTASATAAKSLAEMAAGLPNQGGVASWFAGDNDLGTFGNNLKRFGTDFASYAKSVEGIKPEVVTASTSAAASLCELCKNLPKNSDWLSGEMSLTGLGKQAASFGKYFGTFYSHISGINTATLSGAVREMKNLLNVLKGAQSLNASAAANFGKSLKAIADAGIAQFINAFTNATTKVQNAGGAMMTTFLNGVKSKAASAVSVFVGVTNACVTAIKNTYPTFYRAGAYVSKGFAAGISEGRTNAVIAAKAMATAALEAARRALDEHSPSKAFYEVGRFAGVGFVNALDDFGVRSYQAGSGVGQSAMKGLSQTIQRISDVIDSDIDTQPTIRPVLDLDDIQNGVKKFNKLMPQSGLYSAGTSFNLASHIAKGIDESKQSSNNHSTGGVTMYNTFTEANARDGMALLAMFNRELGGAAW